MFKPEHKEGRLSIISKVEEWINGLKQHSDLKVLLFYIRMVQSLSMG